VGAYARSPAYSWARPYAAENQRVGKTRRRSIYSANRQTRLTNRTASQSDSWARTRGAQVTAGYTVNTYSKPLLYYTLGAVAPLLPCVLPCLRTAAVQHGTRSRAWRPSASRHADLFIVANAPRTFTAVTCRNPGIVTRFSAPTALDCRTRARRLTLEPGGPLPL